MLQLINKQKTMSDNTITTILKKIIDDVIPMIDIIQTNPAAIRDMTFVPADINSYGGEDDFEDDFEE